MNDKPGKPGNQLTSFDKINLIRSFNDHKMKGVEKHLLLTIATHLGDNHFCFLSITTLCKECCYVRETVVSNLNNLVNFGYINKYPPSEGYKSNRYSINFEVIHRLIELQGGVVYGIDQTSLRDRLVQSTAWTSAVYGVDSNRNIKESLKEIKRKRVARSFLRTQAKSKSEKQAKADRAYAQRLAETASEHKQAERRGMSPEARKDWDIALAKLKGKMLIGGNGKDHKT